jgi:hypothetical protein
LSICARARLAKLEQEEQAYTKAHDERGECRPGKPAELHLSGPEPVVLVGDDVTLDRDQEHETERSPERHRTDQSPHRPRLVPGRRGIDCVCDRKTEALRGDERMPERTGLLDVKDRGDTGVDRKDQRDGLPGEPAKTRDSGRPPRGGAGT